MGKGGGDNCFENERRNGSNSSKGRELGHFGQSQCWENWWPWMAQISMLAFGVEQRDEENGEGIKKGAKFGTKARIKMNERRNFLSYFRRGKNKQKLGKKR